MGVAGGVNVYRFNNGNPVSFGDPLGLMGCDQNPAACALVARSAVAVATANPVVGVVLVAGAAVALATQPEVRAAGAEVVKSVKTTIRKVAESIAIAVGLATSDQMQRIEPEPPKRPETSASGPPGLGRSPVEIGKDGIPRIRLPLDPKP